MAEGMTATEVREAEQKADEERRATMLRLVAVDSPAGHASFLKAAEIAHERLTQDNWHSEAQVIRALVRHATELYRLWVASSASASRMQAELAARSRETGEAIARAEKAEAGVADVNRRFEIQRQEILRLQREIGDARAALRTAAVRAPD